MYATTVTSLLLVGCGWVMPSTCQTNKNKSEQKMSTTDQNPEQQPSEALLKNLEEIENEIQTSSAYFKPTPDKTYIIKLDPENDKIVPVENERFKDAQGKPLKRYELKITHVNNGREQTWTVSKTVCMQIVDQLRKGYRVLKVTRRGVDRTTTYLIEGQQ
jgi:hypothetical protein